MSIPPPNSVTYITMFLRLRRHFQPSDLHNVLTATGSFHYEPDTQTLTANPDIQQLSGFLTDDQTPVNNRYQM